MSPSVGLLPKYLSPQSLGEPRDITENTSHSYVSYVQGSIKLTDPCDLPFVSKTHKIPIKATCFFQIFSQALFEVLLPQSSEDPELRTGDESEKPSEHLRFGMQASAYYVCAHTFHILLDVLIKQMAEPS